MWLDFPRRIVVKGDYEKYRKLLTGIINKAIFISDTLLKNEPVGFLNYRDPFSGTLVKITRVGGINNVEVDLPKEKIVTSPSGRKGKRVIEEKKKYTYSIPVPVILTKDVEAYPSEVNGFFISEGLDFKNYFFQKEEQFLDLELANNVWKTYRTDDIPSYKRGVSIHTGEVDIIELPLLSVNRSIDFDGNYFEQSSVISVPENDNGTYLPGIQSLPTIDQVAAIAFPYRIDNSYINSSGGYLYYYPDIPPYTSYFQLQWVNMLYGDNYFQEYWRDLIIFDGSEYIDPPVDEVNDPVYGIDPQPGYDILLITGSHEQTYTTAYYNGERTAIVIQGEEQKSAEFVSSELFTKIEVQTPTGYPQCPVSVVRRTTITNNLGGQVLLGDAAFVYNQGDKYKDFHWWMVLYIYYNHTSARIELAHDETDNLKGTSCEGLYMPLYGGPDTYVDSISISPPENDTLNLLLKREDGKDQVDLELDSMPHDAGYFYITTCRIYDFKGEPFYVFSWNKYLYATDLDPIRTTITYGDYFRGKLNKSEEFPLREPVYMYTHSFEKGSMALGELMRAAELKRVVSKKTDNIVSTN